MVSCMSGKPDYAGRRTAWKAGGSVVVSLPSKELRDAGINVEDLEGEDLYTQVENREMRVDLDVDAND